VLLDFVHIEPLSRTSFIDLVWRSTIASTDEKVESSLEDTTSLLEDTRRINIITVCVIIVYCVLFKLFFTSLYVHEGDSTVKSLGMYLFVSVS